MAQRTPLPEVPTVGALVLWKEKLAYFLEQEAIETDPETPTLFRAGPGRRAACHPESERA